MNWKRIVCSVLAVMILVGCSGNTPTETATVTQAVTEVVVNPEASATQPQVTVEVPEVATDATATVTSLPISATPEPPRPTNVAGCTNSAAFVTDVTIPDNTQLDGGAEIVKTWRIMNNGTCIWASDYKLAYYSEERMNAPAEVPLAITYPGQTLDISVPLTAPNSTGAHRGNFVIKNPEGLIMKISDDSRLWLIINVGTTVAATAANTATVAVSGATNVPTPSPATGTEGGGFANVTCAYAVDQAKLNEVLTAINAYRGQFGMFVYRTNLQLMRAAQAHANDMACNNLFGHTGSNGSTVESRVAASGYTAAFASENVYGSNPPLTGQQATDWWVNDQTDPRHKLNLVSDTFIEIGVGYAFFNNYGYYVIVFASP